MNHDQHAHEALQRALQAADAEHAQQGDDTPRRRFTDQRPNWLTLGNILRALLVSALFAVYLMGGFPGAQEQDALCSTDTDCMRLCPPPGDDPDCDGGPQS